MQHGTRGSISNFASRCAVCCWDPLIENTAISQMVCCKRNMAGIFARYNEHRDIHVSISRYWRIMLDIKCNHCVLEELKIIWGNNWCAMHVEFGYNQRRNGRYNLWPWWLVLVVVNNRLDLKWKQCCRFLEANRDLWFYHTPVYTSPYRQVWGYIAKF